MSVASCGPSPFPTPSASVARFAGTTVSGVAYANSKRIGPKGGRAPARRADAWIAVEPRIQ